uniref:SBP-type domain-containing protein n=1 Tax=Nelumbo nucifera TaxID=4432 RepID=A0A822YG50_NELNU|nr:TPA_asm: hypothetical protein HUJ06_031424 [Nelumbo nucifera]
MEMGSNSLAVSAASGSSDSLNGLKFGKKIYFEDVGIGSAAKSGGGSSSVSVSVSEGSTSTSMAPAPAPTKKGRGVVQGGQPPRCQVEGCKVDLSGAKAYYSRHKVCGMHSKSPKVIVAGLEQRFCQQCSRSVGFCFNLFSLVHINIFKFGFYRSFCKFSSIGAFGFVGPLFRCFIVITVNV